MTGAEFLEVILPQWRASLPSSVPRSYFDRFVARKRAELEAKFGALLEHLSQAKARPTTPPAQDIDAPADLRLVQASHLLINESILTGEAEPNAKHADVSPPAGMS